MYTKSHFAPTADRSRLSAFDQVSLGFEQWVLREAISDRAPFQNGIRHSCCIFHSMTCSHGHTVQICLMDAISGEIIIAWDSPDGIQ